ncbi:MAG TPA: hypothetical protein VGX92_05605 [Pyrinomonadaceae bacterium]|jgi:hypothetical protein|nr:hypothetical protein [Pyrinomonadaceae bacterium]
MNAAYSAPADTDRYGRMSLIAGIVFTLLLATGFFLSPRELFFRSYLFAYVFWTGIALGCLAILMLQHLSGGGWGLVIRRVLEAATRTLPLMALLFVPIIFGMGYLYEWTHMEQLSHGRSVEERHLYEMLVHKSKYLNVTGFILRSVAYFVIWGVLAYLLNLWSREQDRTAERRYAKKLQNLSGPGLVLFVLTVTFASVDWVMSLDPEWFSTIFGLLFVAAWVLSSFAFVIAVMALLSQREPMSNVVAPSHFHDLGKLLLAFVMVWAYFAFSQFLLIWSANIPEETKWYLYRMRGGWGVLPMALVIFHFALPFLLLLSRDLKRNAPRLALVAGIVLVMRLVDLFWLIAPKFSEGRFQMTWMDVVAPLGIGGLWLAFFLWQLKQRPLVPFNDPQLAEVLEARHRKGH